jgi:hypothetical protein
VTGSGRSAGGATRPAIRIAAAGTRVADGAADPCGGGVGARSGGRPEAAGMLESVVEILAHAERNLR